MALSIEGHTRLADISSENRHFAQARVCSKLGQNAQAGHDSGDRWLMRPHLGWRQGPAGYKISKQRSTSLIRTARTCDVQALAKGLRSGSAASCLEATYTCLGISPAVALTGSVPNDPQQGKDLEILAACICDWAIAAPLPDSQVQLQTTATRSWSLWL